MTDTPPRSAPPTDRGGVSIPRVAAGWAPLQGGGWCSSLLCCWASPSCWCRGQKHQKVSSCCRTVNFRCRLLCPPPTRARIPSGRESPRLGAPRFPASSCRNWGSTPISDQTSPADPTVRLFRLRTMWADGAGLHPCLRSRARLCLPDTSGWDQRLGSSPTSIRPCRGIRLSSQTPPERSRSSSSLRCRITRKVNCPRDCSDPRQGLAASSL